MSELFTGEFPRTAHTFIQQSHATPVYILSHYKFDKHIHPMHYRSTHAHRNQCVLVCLPFLAPHTKDIFLVSFHTILASFHFNLRLLAWSNDSATRCNAARYPRIYASRSTGSVMASSALLDYYSHLHHTIITPPRGV